MPRLGYQWLQQANYKNAYEIYLESSSQPEKDEPSETDKTSEQVPEVSPAAHLSSTKNSSSQEQQKITNNPEVVEDAYAHRSAICIPYRRLSSAR